MSNTVLRLEKKCDKMKRLRDDFARKFEILNYEMESLRDLAAKV
jgi:hypothetical protein